MGYFSNGSEGRDFQEMYCLSCVNNGDELSDEGCAVWDLHTSYNSDQFKPGLVQIGEALQVHGPTVAALLGGLIQHAPTGGQKCLMFRPRPELAVEGAGQMTLLERFDREHGAPTPHAS